MLVGLVFAGIVILALLWGVATYNGLVASRGQYQNAFSQIDVQLKRRNDLIPNLVETAKGYMRHERETLEGVVAARNQAVSALQAVEAAPGDEAAMRRLAQAEQGLSGVMGRLFAVSEAYPELKANQNMIALSEELTSTENRVSFARQAYNDSVTKYNIQRETFPVVLISNFMGFSAATLFEIQDVAEREAPKVRFNEVA